MSRGTRIVLIIAAVLVSGSFLMAGAATIYVYRDGMIDVNVQEKGSGGTYVHVMVPTTLVRAVLWLAPLDDETIPGPEARACWPLVEAACSGIARSPDGVLVQVDSPDEHVRIEKRGGSLVIDVDDPETKVHVSIPVRAVEYVVRRMRPSSPGWGSKASINLTLSSATPPPSAPDETSTPARASRRA